MMKHYLTAALLVTANTILFAAPLPAPTNDDCVNAITLTVNSTCSFTQGTVDQATQSNVPYACNGITSTSAFDVWYKFTAGANGQTITVKGSASFDAVLVLMDNCTGTSIDCSDQTGSGGTEMITTTGLTPNNTYYIRVYHYGSTLPTTLTFDICVALPAPPPVNDDCINAITLSVDSICTPVSGTVAGCTQSTAPDSCNSFASASAFDVWYKFVATAADNVIKVQGALSFDAVVILKDGCNGATVNCSDHTGGGGIETIADSSLIIGNTYYIRVYAYGQAIPSTPDFDICISPPPPPPAYDNCTNAMLLSVDSVCNYTQGSVAGATQSAPPDTCGTFTSSTAYDVWYKFIAGANGQTITVKGSASFDAVVSLRDSCSGPIIACSDQTFSGGTEKINASGLISGNTYYIRVYHYGSAMPSTPDFEICVSLPPPAPVNDTCANAISLSVDSACNYSSGTVAGSTQGVPADSCSGFASVSAFDVWYKFVASATDNVVTVQGSISFDAVVVLKDTCGGTTIGCSDRTGSGGIETIADTNLIVGNTYYIRVYAYGSTEPSTPDFNICVSLPAPPPPNDDCANAIILTANPTCTAMSGTVAGSTQSMTADSCNGFHSSATYDVWYKFTAVASAQTITVKGSQSFDAVIVLRDNCSSAPIDCTDSSTSGGTEVIHANSLIVGNTYYVRVYAYGGALPSTSGFDICLLDSGPMSVSAIENKNNWVSVYPNPAANTLTIGLKSTNNSESVRYKILNVNGQILAEGRFAANSLQKEIDIHSLSSGIYTIQINISETVINKKIVVMNK